MVAAFVVAVVLLTTFVFWERHTDHPILDVTFFKNPRFTAASIAITLVFFAMFGSLFFVSQYLQFVLGYTALKSGVRLLPVAVALMVAAPLSAKLVGLGRHQEGRHARAGARRRWRCCCSRGSPTPAATRSCAAVLVIIGVGMGLAMAPATDSIMGSLPPEKAGVGSAMNDTTREIGGALGVAIMGSITTAVLHVADHRQRRTSSTLQAASPEAADAVKDSVGARVGRGRASCRPSSPQPITAAANDAFIHAIDRTVIVGAVVALLGAARRLLLPARARPTRRDEPIDGARRRRRAALLDDPEQRLGSRAGARSGCSPTPACRA